MGSLIMGHIWQEEEVAIAVLKFQFRRNDIITAEAEICHKESLNVALAMNEPLSKAYYLKEQLREIWAQINKKQAEAVLNDWVNQARESKIPQLVKMAATLLAHRRGILAWYDCHISTGKVEGINNKIKVMKRNAYGFRDERYFTLRLYALHDCRITRNVG